jgi:hypothetical protein
VLFFLQRLVVGRWLAGRLLQRAAPAPLAPGLVAGLCRQLGIRGPVTVGLCRQCGIPFTFGTLRPAILLPEGAPAWPARRLQAVLLHELTHIRRRESLLNSAAAAVCALLWFLPVVWLAYSRMRAEAEESSDRSVLRHGIPGTDYASDLVELVHGARGLILPGGAAVPLARKRLARERVRRVLAWRGGGPGRRIKTAGIVLTVAFGCLLFLLASTGAGPAGDSPLVGSWINPKALHFCRAVWRADGRVFEYTMMGSDTPFAVGRYTIERRWTDGEGSTWYHVNVRASPPPYRQNAAWTNCYLLRVNAAGTTLEFNKTRCTDGYADKLTLGEYGALHRERPR